MPVKNWQYGAARPTVGLSVIEDQFLLMHRYRNWLVERERERRREAFEVVRRRFPMVAELEAAAESASAEAMALANAVGSANQAASVAAGASSGLMAKPAIGAAKEAKAVAIRAKSAARDAWLAFKAKKAEAYANDGVQEEMKEIDGRYEAERKLHRAGCGLFWCNKAEVESAASSIRSGGPPQFLRWHEVDRHTVAVQIQGGMTVGELFEPNTLAWVEESGRPAGESGGSNRSRRRYLTLHVRVQSTASGRPVWAEVPFVMHREMPADGLVKWVKVHRLTVGTGHKWSILFSVQTPNRLIPDAAPSGVVGFAFGARQCGDGVEVATWAGDDGATGRIVVPASDLSRYDEGPRLRSAVDAITEVLKSAMGEWAAGRPAVVCERPFDTDQGEPDARLIAPPADGLSSGFRGYFGRPDEAPSSSEVSARLRQWRSPARFARLHEWWAANRFAGDEDGFALLGEWVYRYRHLENWRANAAFQHARWRLDLFRRAAAVLRRRYRTAVIPTAAGGEAIVSRPKLKAVGDEWVPPPDNGLKRAASCGTLRQVLVEAFADPLHVKPKVGQTASDVLASAADGLPAIKERGPRFKSRTKPAEVAA